MERYYSYSRFIKEYFGEKLYKICIDGGFTCPNRDGTLATGGCIFCSEGGSGEFTENASLSVSEQIHLGKSQTSRKYQGEHYIAYFQAFTNTYAPVDRLRALYEEAITAPEIVALSIGTRPDCITPEILDLLEELNKRKPVFIEMGLQTSHDSTASFLNRAYPTETFTKTCHALAEAGIRVTHIPTNTVVECQDERSQHKNKEKALSVLRSRLYEAEVEKQRAAIAADRKSQVGTGDRSERIRTYNFPENRVSDHRIKRTIYKLDQFLNGDMDEILDALIAADTAEKLKEQSEM